MKYYVGLDVSLEETSLCVVDETGEVVREVKVRIPMKTASHSDGKRPPVPIQNGQFGRRSIWAA